MRAVVRLGDSSSHGGTVITASSRVRVGGAPVARAGDLHSCPVPGHGITAITSGAARCNVEGSSVARDGDVVGCGAVLLASQARMIAGG